jgi:hypothetical protein
MTAVFLDPPYGTDDRDTTLYGENDSTTIAADVRKWCRANGRNKLLRIALAGYAGEGHEALEAHDWTCLAWKSPGGFASQAKTRMRQNCTRERIWFSPACLGKSD